MNEQIARELPSQPTSVLVYARTRSELDRYLAAVAGRVGKEPVWIEVVDRTASPTAAEQPDASVANGLPRIHEFEAAELLPQQALANLSVWVSGRPRESPTWLREAEEMTWLPLALQAALRRRPDDGTPLPVVVCRAERLVTGVPLGLDEARHLLRVLARRGVTLICGILVRPRPEFAALFSHVLRVRSSYRAVWETSALGRLRAVEPVALTAPVRPASVLLPAAVPLLVPWNP